MKNLKVSAKLIASFLIVIALAVIVGVVGAFGTLTLSGNEGILYTKGVKGTFNGSGMYSVLVEQRIELRGMIIDMDQPDVVNACIDALRAREDEYEMMYRDLLAAMPEMEKNVNLKQAMDVYDGQFTPIKERMISAFRAGDSRTMMSEYRQIAQSALQVTDAIYKVMADVDKTAADLKDADSSLTAVLIIIQFGVLLVCIAVSLIMAFYLSGIIAKPLKDMMGYIKQAGETGNLHFRDDEWANCDRLSAGRDEIGQTMKAFTAMMRKFVHYGEAVGQVAAQDLTLEVATLGDSDTFGNAIRQMVDNLNEMFGEIHSSTAQVNTGSKQ
ncbi:MAG: methyl-accepting chemotaxis protein, partial [Oscillospiraceae bacterium]|nr:methyl-accepting chemotaxis protein [Oscillospiraceae bacterium]